MTIFGVDIASGSPNSRQVPSYSLVVMNGDAKSDFHMISRHKLIRLIREKQPDIVAVDNVYELASDRKDLIALLRRLPPSMKLVQVTGGDKPEALARVAKWHGLIFDRTDPLEEAEVCAQLAAKGIGQVLSAFEDRTWIKVSRRRSPGRGGWSQNRYSRKIHGAVKGLAREVEKQLREAEMEFTIHAVEGLGGYTRAEFVIEAPREKVHINHSYYCDAQIKVQSIERPQLEFKPLLKRRGYIIVGLDPGTTTGIAAVDLEGRLVDLISARAMSSSNVIEWIAARGKPLIVATDVYPTPGAVEKVKRTFNSMLYSPGADVPTEDKIALAKEIGYKNDHERDALAAAISAFKKYKNKFLLVEKKVPEDIDPDEVKALVVKGYSLESAICELTSGRVLEKQEPEPQELIVPPEALALRCQNQQLTEQVKNLRDYLEELKAELKEKDEFSRQVSLKLERLSDKTFREIKRDQEIKIRDKEIERLRSLLRSERKYARKLKRNLSQQKKTERIEEAKGLRRIKILETFSKEAVALAIEQGAVGKGDLILLQDASGGGKNTAELLIGRGIDALITDGDMAPSVREHFQDRGIPIFTTKDLAIQRINGVPFVRPEDIEVAKAMWIEHARTCQAERKAEWLESLLREYKVERRKEELKKLKQN